MPSDDWDSDFLRKSEIAEDFGDEGGCADDVEGSYAEKSRVTI